MLDFFPSRRLTIYLAKLLIVRILAVLVMLVLVLLMLDLLSNSGKILAVKGNGQGELLTYARLRFPQLVTSFVPYSVLLASILTLVTLNQNSEVIAMKAAGLSAQQILAPFLLTAMFISVGGFFFNEAVTTKATARLKVWQALEFGQIPDQEEARANIYLTDGHNILAISTVYGVGESTVMDGVTWYERDDQDMIVREARAAKATFASPGWRLDQPELFTVASATTKNLPEMVVGENITINQLALENINPEAESIWKLSRSIDAYQEAGRNTTEMRAKWWHKISGPFSSVLMPLLGAVAGFGLARSGGLFVRAVIGMVLGFAYFVVDNAAMAMGNFGGYPPFLAAWAPFMLFFLIGETVLLRTEE